MATSFYMAYIAADALWKRLREVGAKFNTISVPTGANSRSRMYAALEDYYVDSESTWRTPEELAAMRAERERIIVDFLNLVPGSYSDRDGNRITLHGSFHGVRFHVTVGEALCERVEVGEKTIEKIDPDYLLDAPKVTVTEKVYEWRCSDDILGSMAHKAGA